MYLVAAAICYNEKFFAKHWLMSFYDQVDEIVIVDAYSNDGTVEIIKSLDINKKVTIIERKWDNNYSNARNTYLDYIKKNIWPKHRSDTYYLRTDCDEIIFEDWLKKTKEYIDDNPDCEAVRGNFYHFTQDLNHLDTGTPTESRVSLFKYTPDIVYKNKLHEMPVHGNGIPLYASPMDDSKLGIWYAPGYAYLHYSWTDPIRTFQKAVNYTKIYVEQGTETKEHLETIAPTKESWHWNKKSDIRYKGKLPEVFEKYGLLEGQLNPEEDNGKTKISAYGIIGNAIKFSYPVIEAINSLLPIVDEYVLNVKEREGEDDNTLGLIEKVFGGIEKVKIHVRKWEDRSQGTAFLRNQSNWAKEQCKNNIVLYNQSDEVYHEDDLEKILSAAKTLEERQDLVGAIFKWNHFDGKSTHVNKDSYPAEVRMIKKNTLQSIGDGQSMGVITQQGVQNVMLFPQLLLDADVKVYHYGWLRPPENMLKKLRSFDSFYHTDEELREMSKDDDKKHKNGLYNYGEKIDNFQGTHPSVMYPYITRYERENGLQQKARFN